MYNNNKHSRSDNNLERKYLSLISNLDKVANNNSDVTINMHDEYNQIEKKKRAKQIINKKGKNRSLLDNDGAKVVGEQLEENYYDEIYDDEEDDDYSSESDTFSFTLRPKNTYKNNNGLKQKQNITNEVNLRNLSYLNSTQNDWIDLIITQAAIKPKVDDNKNKTTETDTENSKPKSLLQKFLESKKKRIMETSLFRPIDSQNSKYLLWLAVVSLAYVYNVIGISLRYSFDIDFEEDLDNSSYLTMSRVVFNETSNETYFIEDSIISEVHKFYRNKYWMIADYVADVIYLIDIFVIKTRLRFVKDGLWVSDLKSTFLHYYKSPNFFVSNNI